jgi:hypothetical protein
MLPVTTAAASRRGSAFAARDLDCPHGAKLIEPRLWIVIRNLAGNHAAEYLAFVGKFTVLAVRYKSL